MISKIKIGIVSALLLLSISVNAQTTAYDFQGDDCNGNPVNLFSDLDAGKAVVLFYYMPNCGTCPPIAANVQAMSNKINALCPNLIKGYAYPFQNSTTCSYSSSWVTDNALSLYTPMDSGAYQVAYYGGFGMPTVVLVGGSNHDVLWSTQNFVDSDTTVMRDIILGMSCLGLQEQGMNAASIEVYPNPASETCSIEFNNEIASATKIRVLDMTGKILFEKNIQGKNTKETIELDVSHLSLGTYFIQLSNDQHFITKKLEVLK